MSGLRDYWDTRKGIRALRKQKGKRGFVLLPKLLLQACELDARLGLRRVHDTVHFTVPNACADVYDRLKNRND